MKRSVAHLLETRLARPLPGPAAHQRAWPAELPSREARKETSGYRQAAVLLGLYHSSSDSTDTGGFRIPMIQRPSTMADHAGQIALPGGRIEVDETALECALREAHEEVGLPASRVRILGSLSPVEIPVSRFRVEVFVGWIEECPEWIPEEGEVVRILEADPDRLVRAGTTKIPKRLIEDQQLWEVPAYPVEDALVWGATALMLAEFLWIWEEVLGSGR